MNTPARLGAYGLGLIAVFGATLGIGGLTGIPGPGATPATPAHDAHAQPSAATAEPAAELPGGLQVAQDGYRLVPITTTLATGDPAPFRFRIDGPDGRPVTAYTPSHERDLHLIVVRRDLTGYRHVHPTIDSGGTWEVPLAVPEPGAYRVFADFQPAARADGLTLGADVAAPGDYRPRPLAPPAATATVDGYTVTLDGTVTAGGSTRLTTTISREGRPVTDLEPYLGAYGHLVAIRDGDLAYLHVHPEEGSPGPAVAFHVEVPSAGSYRLFLDFQHGGVVRTAEFTVSTDPAAVPAATPAPVPSESTHGEPGHTHG